MKSLLKIVLAFLVLAVIAQSLAKPKRFPNFWQSGLENTLN